MTKSPSVLTRTENAADYQDASQIALLEDKQWSYVGRRHHITERELQIAKLVCRGLSNDKIAKKLRIRPGTVKTHIRNIYRKTGVSNKIAMLLTFVNDVNNV